MKWKLDRIISVATLVVSLAALFLVLKKPQPVSQPQSPAAAAANVESLEKKLEQLEQPKDPGQAPAQVRFNSDEITAALAQAKPHRFPRRRSQRRQRPPLRTNSAAPGSLPSSPDAVIRRGRASGEGL